MTPSPPNPLDLRGTPCPLNYVRTRLALERLPAGAELEVWLDRGEPERLVSEGLRGEGYTLDLCALDPQAVRLCVRVPADG
jgi:TusA-related sulfurtransferase